jgi:outer membrane immunogenic protein
MRLALPLLVVAAMMSAPVSAQNSSFEGLSVTGVAGLDHARAGGSFSGAVYGAQIGYDWRMSGLVLGVEGEITGSTADRCFTGSGVTPVRSCTSLGRDIFAGARIGTMIADERALIYGKVGYTNARASFRIEDAANALSGAGNADGFRVGAGLEAALGSGLLVKAEYRFSDYDGGTSRHQGVVGLGFRF